MLNSLEINCVKRKKGLTKASPKIFRRDNLEQFGDFAAILRALVHLYHFWVNLQYNCPDAAFVFPPFSISAVARLLRSVAVNRVCTVNCYCTNHENLYIKLFKNGSVFEAPVI